MKKLLAIVLVIAVLFSFAACAGTGDIRGEQVGQTQEEEFSVGKVEGLKYESKFIGIGCKLPDDWTFYTDEQIREINNMTADMAGEEFQEALKNAKVIYDMFASKSESVENINVNLEKVNAVQLVGLNLEKNFEAQISTIRSTFENMGCTNITCKVDKVTVDGKEMACLKSTTELAGVKMHQVCLAIKCSGYLATITITASSESSLEALLEAFYWLK